VGVESVGCAAGGDGFGGVEAAGVEGFSLPPRFSSFAEHYVHPQ
jgi:hypothetical protein